MFLYPGPVTGLVYKLARALVARDMWWVAGKVLLYSTLWPSDRMSIYFGTRGAKVQPLWPTLHACLQYVWIRDGKSWVLSIVKFFHSLTFSLLKFTVWEKISVGSQLKETCFPIFQDGFQLFKWAVKILYQGPVTGPVYTLAPALVLRITSLFWFRFPIFQDLLSNFSSQTTCFISGSCNRPCIQAGSSPGGPGYVVGGW